MKAKGVQGFIKGLENPLQIIGYEIMCKGCGHKHLIYTYPGYYKVTWGFNGNVDKPTFTPSINEMTGSFADPKYIDDPAIPPTRCHYIITDGKIYYCGDSTHSLKGQTIELPEIE